MKTKYFTPEHKTKIEREYGDCEPKPGIYNLTTLEKNKSERDEIESALMLLYEPVSSKVWEEINNAKHDNANLHSVLAEMQCGVWLTKKFDEQIVFHPKIDGQTPDWAIESGSARKALIEVYRPGEPGQQKTVREKGEQMIPEILSLVPHPAHLSVKIEAFSTATPQAIAKNVSLWLADDFARRYDHRFGGFVFGFNGWIPDAPHAKAIGHSYKSFSDPRKLIDVIEEKIGKYYPLLTNTKIPFFLFVVNSFESPVDCEEAQMLLWGRSCEDHSNDGPIVYSHGLEGLFYDRDKRDKIKYLSGVAIIPDQAQFESPIMIENRWALNPLRALVENCVIPLCT